MLGYCTAPSFLRRCRPFSFMGGHGIVKKNPLNRAIINNVVMAWYIIEPLLITTLGLSILPIKFEWKKIITLTSSVILTAVFGFFLLLNCDFVQTLTLKYFYLENITTNNVNPFLSYVIFGFPIVFVLDNLSLSFVFLTTLTILICILTVYKNPTYNSSLYYLLLWTLQFSLIHTFTSLNLLSFYVFFELTLVPMFLIIVIWGSRQRKIHAGYLFFLYCNRLYFFIIGYTFTLLLYKHTVYSEPFHY